MTGLEEATAARPDGRFERSRRTRTAVIDALLELQAEGELSPSAKRVAEQAGVSPRTMYLHFADMEALFVEVGDRFLARLAGIGEPVPHTGPFEAHGSGCSASGAPRSSRRCFRCSARPASVSRSPQHCSPTGTATCSPTTWRSMLCSLPGSQALPGPARSHVRAGVHLATCAAGWDVLRDDRGLDLPSATDVMARTLRGLLG